MASDRNPIVIPKADSAKKVCMKCGSGDWFGRNIQGSITFKCKSCGFTWYGGLPQVPEDPTVPRPPEADPSVLFVANPKIEGGVEEIRRRPDHRQEFRKGAPIPTDEE